LALHFRRGRELASNYDCYVVKVIGDAFFVAFRNSTDAVGFAIEFSKDTGVDFIGIRIGIHSGQVQIMENDIYGLNVNKTARIQSSIEKEGISVSDSIKEDFIKAYGSNSSLKFIPNSVEIKNFRNSRIWKATNQELIMSYRKTIKNREEILGNIEKKPINPQSNYNTHNTSESSLVPIRQLSSESIFKSKLSNPLSSNWGIKIAPKLEPPDKK